MQASISGCSHSMNLVPGARRVFSAGAAWRPRSYSNGPGRLGGRNIFELRAVPQANAAGTTAEAPPSTSPAQPGQKGPAQQQAKASPSQPSQETFVPLPTSDESEALLRIRHSVRGQALFGGVCERVVGCAGVGTPSSAQTLRPDKTSVCCCAECSHDGHGRPEAVQGCASDDWPLD